MNKRLENRINLWYDQEAECIIGTRVWLAKHWHRWITYGCKMCWIENCGCPTKREDINSPRGFAKMAEYCYDNYGEHWKNQ